MFCWHSRIYTMGRNWQNGLQNDASKILNEDCEYAIFLPVDYEKSTGQFYPVLYLLHGGGESHKE